MDNYESYMQLTMETSVQGILLLLRRETLLNVVEKEKCEMR